MKFRITFKTPDAIQEFLDGYDGEDDYEDVTLFIREYVTYGEYVRLEFDTKTKTVKVLKVDE